MKKLILIGCLFISITLVGCSNPVKVKELLPEKYSKFLGEDNTYTTYEDESTSHKIKKPKNNKIKIDKEEQLKERNIEVDVKNDVIISKFIKDFEFNKNALNEARELGRMSTSSFGFKGKIDISNFKKNVERYNEFLVQDYEYKNQIEDKKLDSLLYYLDKYNRVFMKYYCEILSPYKDDTILGYCVTYLEICEVIIRSEEEYINKLKNYIEVKDVDFNLEEGVEISKELVANLEKQYEDNNNIYYHIRDLTFSSSCGISLENVDGYKKSINNFKSMIKDSKDNSVKCKDPILKSIIERYNRANYNFKKAYIEVFDVDKMSSNNVLFNAKKLNDCKKSLSIQHNCIESLRFFVAKFL